MIAMALWCHFDAFSPACGFTAQEPIWSSMVSNNAAEFSSGFGLRVISVLGSDECAPRIARSTSSGARSLRTVVLLSLPFKSWSVLLS